MSRWISEEDTHKRHKPSMPKRWTKRLRKRYAMKVRRWGAKRNLTPLGIEMRDALVRGLMRGKIGEYSSFVFIESDSISSEDV